MTNLIDYYKGVVTDKCKRSIYYTLRQDFEFLEYTHDYIQYLFPLPEPSAYNPGAPILTYEHVVQWKKDYELQIMLRKAFNIMLDFYGFKYINDTIVKSNLFEERARNWITNNNHNYLRISRILRSISLLGMNKDAKLFFDILELDVYENFFPVVSETTFHYWYEAVKSGSPL